ncbi:MAG: hypothetical protein WCC92_21840 [Candidatus Korobacteraceae bacterium]
MTTTIRSLWGTVALVLVALFCLAPAALAGTVGAQISDPPSNNVLDGIYVGSYSATNTGSGAPMQIICDDFRDESNYNPATYATNTFNSLGSTLWGSLLQGRDSMSQITALYEQAGWLASGVMSTSGTQQGYYSYALWAVFDPTDVFNWLKTYNDAAACNAIFGGSSGCTNDGAAAGGLLYSAEQNYMYGNYSNLVILTPNGCGNVGCPEQEFFEFVPEGGSPLSYLLLAGLACFATIWLSRRHNPAARTA